MIDINLTGVWNTVQGRDPAPDRDGGGSIVLTSSTAGLAGVPQHRPLHGGQARRRRADAGLAVELAPRMIRVNTIHPTTVDTPMVLNEATYELFRPDGEHPTTRPFEALSSAA